MKKQRPFIFLYIYIYIYSFIRTPCGTLWGKKTAIKEKSMITGKVTHEV